MRRQGSAAVEAAVLFGVVALLGLGVVEWGHYLHHRAVVVGAVQEGAARAVVTTSTGDYVGAATSQVQDSLTRAGLTMGSVTVTLEGEAPAPVVVVATAPYAPIQGLVPVPIEVVASHVMLMER